MMMIMLLPGPLQYKFVIAYKANMYIFTNSLSGPFFTYLVKDKNINIE